MITPHAYKDKTVAVVGLGRSGQATVRALKAAGATVWAWDDQQDDKTGMTDLYAADWSQVDILVLSPGIPHTYPKPHELADKARAHNVPIICDVELLVKAQPHARYVAITGTNGKSTTTALIGHILDVCGFDVQIGGNFGIPALDLNPSDADGVYVLELSSYQLERTPSLQADVAVWLNISADHLDRHGDMAGYIAAKKHIFDNQSDHNIALIGLDDPHSQAIFADNSLTKARKIGISGHNVIENGIFCDEGILIDEAFDPEGQQIMDLSAVKTLQGDHNQQNAAMAFGAATALGAAPEWIVRGIASFAGLTHRQEIVDAYNGVTFINDSKATNAEAAEKALGAYDHIYWIAGGQAKDGGIDSLVPNLKDVAKSYLIGDAAEGFAQTLEGHCPSEICNTLDVAVKAACRDAMAAGQDAVVLLSPACASWDQFKSFEHRGETFSTLVKDLLDRLDAGEAL